MTRNGSQSKKKWRGEEEGGERHYLRCYKPPRGEELRRLYSTVYTGHDRYLYLPTSFLPLKRIISSSYSFLFSFREIKAASSTNRTQTYSIPKERIPSGHQKSLFGGGGRPFFSFQIKKCLSSVYTPVKYMGKQWETARNDRNRFFFLQSDCRPSQGPLTLRNENGDRNPFVEDMRRNLFISI